jgi:hypothetical protein
MVIFWTGAGPRLSYENGFLNIDDLNPEHHLHWRMSRWEMIKIGLRCVFAALRK